MKIYDPTNKNGIQIQVKPLDKNSKSRSFTIHDIDADEAFDRIFFLFEQLSQVEGNITIIHYKNKEEKNEQRIN